MKKRILSLVLVFSMLASLAIFMPITASAKTLEPVAKVDWNGHTYHVYDESMTWEEAKQYCENSGGYLATFTSEQEWKTIQSLIIKNGKHCWFGGYGKGSIDTWVWITGEEWQYTDWCPGEPNNDYSGTENYLGTYTSSYRWNDYRESTKLGFVCEFGDANIQNQYYFNGHRYQVFDKSMTWNDANDFCTALGGHLATITSEDEQKIIENLIDIGDKYQYWLGATDEGHEGEWTWVTDEVWSYSNWDARMPDNAYGKEHYLQIYKKQNPRVSGSNPYKWNDITFDNVYNNEEDFFETEHTGFICEWDDEATLEQSSENRIELSSNRPTLSVVEGDSFDIVAELYLNDELQKMEDGVTFSIENESVAKITDTSKGYNLATVEIRAKKPGSTTIKASYPKEKLVTTAYLTIIPQSKNSYTIYNVPKQTVQLAGWANAIENNNFYNFAGMHIDEYKKTVHDDKSCDISFDVYNTNWTYGIAEVYNQDGEICDAVIIDKYADKNTTIKESLFDNLKSLYCDISSGEIFTYRQESGYSAKTSVSIKNIPSGGYVKITSDPSESLLLCFLNEIDIVMTTQNEVEKIAGFAKATNKKWLQSLADKLVKEDESGAVKKALKDISSRTFKYVHKNTVLSPSSMGNFIDSLETSLSLIDWKNMVFEVGKGYGISKAESWFEKSAGAAGLTMKGLFAGASAAALYCEGMSFVNCIDTSAISIQVPDNNTRSYNKVRVQCQKNIDNNMALDTYMITGDNINLVPSKIRNLLNDKPYVEYIDICMVNKGQEKQINSKAAVSIPLSDEMKQYSKIKVYRVEEDGTLTDMHASDSIFKNENYITFDTEHFSLYAIVADENKGEETTSFGSTVSEWAKEEVEEAYDKGLVPEVLVGKDLTEKVDRAEFAAIAVTLYENMSGKNALTSSQNPFNDISGNKCKDDILKAYNLDITTGTSKNTFEPSVNISREQMAAMLTRAYKKSEFDGWTLANDGNYPLNFMGVQKFADDSEISDYAKESVYFMVRWNVINGIGNNMFAPKGNVSLGEAYGFATREQAVCIALRSAKYLK